MIALLLSVALQAAIPAAPPPSLTPCAVAEYGQFDFWVGSWEVTPNIKGATPVANSRIEKLYGGCGIRENWMPLKGTGGGSLNNYDPADDRWHQRWLDSSGGTVDFAGGMAGKEMVLTGWWKHLAGPGKHALIRMRYTRQDDGSVRQHGEQSLDHGLSWSTSFDFIYRPKSTQ